MLREFKQSCKRFCSSATGSHKNWKIQDWFMLDQRLERRIVGTRCNARSHHFSSWIPLLLGLSCLAGISARSLPPACKTDQVATPSPAIPKSKAEFLTYAHSHNDYEQPRPLETTLEQQFYSVEIDIYRSSGEITVSHYPWGSKGTLKKLYLDPLQARVDVKGSVHSDGLPFTLWIDLKEGHTELIDDLYELLESYSMLNSAMRWARQYALTSLGVDLQLDEANSPMPDRHGKQRFGKTFTPISNVDVVLTIKSARPFGGPSRSVATIACGSTPP